VPALLPPAHCFAALIELLDARALEQQRELRLRLAALGLGAVADCALLVDLGLADELACHQLDRAVVFAQRGLVRALRTLEPGTCFQHLLGTRPVHQLGQPMARGTHICLQLGATLRGVAAIELQQGVVLDHCLTFVNHDRDDRLVGLGRQLEPIPLERA
jgi:hypothetical protein